MTQSSGRPAANRGSWTRLASVAVLALAAIALTAGSASAAYVHTNVTGEYGKEGPKLSGTGNGCRIAWQSATHRLYLLSDNKIYGLNRTAPGAASPLAGFPIEFSNSTTCGDRDLEVDNSSGLSKGNIYATPSTHEIFGFSQSGAQLAGFPVDVGTETCGVAVTASGEIWGGDYGASSIARFTSTGAPNGSFALGYNDCKLAVDPTNNHLFALSYGGDLREYAPSGSSFVETLHIGSIGSGNSGLAVNGAQHKIYVANGSPQVTAYDTVTGSVVETINIGKSANDVVVDEPTDTIFVQIGSESEGYIEERPGITVPDATTSGPTGFATAHGHVDPVGAGPVTSCEFEVSAYQEFFPALTKSFACEPATPYAGAQDVSADLTSGVQGEQTSYYRLKVSNAAGTNFSGSTSFIPHFVAGLHPEPATEIDRNSATLNGSFLGTNEETNYYFKWGKTESYGSVTPTGTVPANTIENELSAPLTGLEPGTTYHYAVVGTNAKGTSQSSDATFTTKPAVFAAETEAATEIKTSTAELHGSFEGDGLNVKYFYEYGSSSLYGNATEAGELTAPSGPTTVPGAPIEGLQPLHTYHFRVVLENSFGRTNGPDESFTTNTAPIVIAFTSAHVTATTAELLATINPHGVPAEYHFEYGPTTTYGQKTETKELPAGEAPVAVTELLSNLNGGVYHFRIVAQNQFGQTVSRDQTFNFYSPECPNSSVRQQTGANSLPDCRAYELVTPEDQGITIVYPATVPFSATATSPSRLAFVGAFGLIPNTGEPANNQGDLYVSTRTNQGWKTKYTGIPSSQASLQGGPPWTIPNYEPDKFQMDVLSNQSLSQFAQWDNGIFHIGELFAEEHPENSFAPYVYDANGKQIDRWPTNVGAIPDGVNFRGRDTASADMSHFVFSSDILFAPGAEPGDVYDNDVARNTVKVISVKAGGEHIEGAVPLDTSENGSHILMVVRGSIEQNSGPGALYITINDGAAEEIGGGKSVEYLDMTPDGRKVYFTTAESLLPEDTDTSVDLYMWEEGSPTPGHLVEISKGNEGITGNTDACSPNAGPEGGPWTEQCGIQPITFRRYTSAQGGQGGSPYSDNYIAPGNGNIYFLSPEQLAGNNGVNGEENLYDFREGKLQFVVALDPKGTPCVQDQGEHLCSETAIARIETTPRDETMSFLTSSEVNGYDNAGHSELYTWKPGAEELLCVSCVPSGAPPTNDVRASHNGRYLTNNGRTFFETEDALVPQDTNQAGDVYEYVDGRPQLITSGTNVGNDSMGLATIMALPGLVGVSADGTDAYISTYDVLVGQDRNGEAIKIYDARSSGGFPFAPPVPPCVAADECHGTATEAPAPPVTGTGAQLGESGNVQQPKSGHKKKKAKRHKRSHKKAHKRAHREGGRSNG